jgi:energy-converting hydrogenase Eha subunit A
MLTSLDVQDAVLNFAFIVVKRARRRTRHYSAIFCKDPVMAWTIETLLIGNPPNAAAQMRTYIGHYDKILAVFSQDVG